MVLSSCSVPQRRQILQAPFCFMSHVDFVSSLPEELVRHVICLLDTGSLLRATRVCKDWYSTITGLDIAWSRRIHPIFIANPSLMASSVQPAYRVFLQLMSHIGRMRDSRRALVVSLPTWTNHYIGAGVRGHLITGGSGQMVWVRGSLRSPMQYQWSVMYTVGAEPSHQLCSVWMDKSESIVQYYIDHDSKVILLTGANRSGLIWRDTGRGGVIAQCHAQSISPMRWDTLVCLCHGCHCVVATFHSKDTTDLTAAIFMMGKPETEMSFKLDLSQHSSFTVHHSRVVTSDCCATHQLVLQSYHGCILQYKLGGAVPLDTPIPVQCSFTHTASVMCGRWMNCVLSQDEQLLAFLSGSSLFVLKRNTLSLLHKVDISDCCSAVEDSRLRSIAIGSLFAALGYHDNFTSSLFIISLSGTILFRVTDTRQTLLLVNNLDMLSNLLTGNSPQETFLFSVKF